MTALAFDFSIPLNPSVDKRDVVRLSRQCVAILERLRRGSATNVELAGIALKYTSRTDEVRRYLASTTGELLIATRGLGGVWTYHIESGETP